ncbi:MAG: hypothetical protein ABH873_10410 [Candidatus Firestonebacteria bacterium]
MNNLVKAIVIGLAVGLIGNLVGRATLDYNATYNFPGADQNRINKNLDDNPNIPPYPHTNTLIGGCLVGIMAVVIIGLLVHFFKAEVFYILSALVGFFASGFVVSPYPFYPVGTVPPVAYKYVVFVVIPGIIIAVLIAIFLERFKPKVEEVDTLEMKQQVDKQQQKKK